jgi:hypothetical protein
MQESMAEKPWLKRVRDSRMFRWSVGVSAALILILKLVSYFLDEPLRSMMEKKLNHEGKH